MYKLYCRTFQLMFKVVAPILPWRKPELLEGVDSLSRLPMLIADKDIHRVLIVTDQGITSTGLMDSLLAGLQTAGVDYIVYDKTIPNPTIENIEEALQLYHQSRCQGIIAFGGGSPLDCAKGVGARIARPDKSIPQMKGQLKVRKQLPPLFAVPTTAGTGSEATVAAVISNSETQEKYAINDFSLIPHYAVLDPLLTLNLPPAITAATGMDALTHAIESYIGKSSTAETRDCSRKAVKLVFENLPEAYQNGQNISARDNMQKAAYLAGVAFTRAYVGYVHAIAHTLGGFYSFPHGQANAIILPYVLEYYGDRIHKELAELAEAAGIASEGLSIKKNAFRFIEEIKKINKTLSIPDKIPCIADCDIPIMVERAFHEANPLYPVPKILDKNDLFKLYHLIKA
jgi:alcohol dehydrogenase